MGVEPSPRPSLFAQLKNLLIGRPRDLADQSMFHKLALIPLLAWVGLGSDGLSSSAYGPDEAFRTLASHTYLAILLVLATSITVFVISAAYSRIIEDFPHGGGGYVVASKLLGHRAGVVSGCALLVDYVLTITVSIAAAGDALFSFLPLHLHGLKLPLEGALILLLIVLNLRGVKESVLFLAPIFMLFLVTHVLAILGGVVAHIPEIGTTVAHVQNGFKSGADSIGWGAMLLLFVHAYSLGGGTYTGLEAVSNGLPIMREPKVQTAKRTMSYMAFSLAFTASGLLLCYLLWQVVPAEGKTMNAVLFERLTGSQAWGPGFVIVALVAEGLLLIVGAQAGFIDGPRVLANMAIDSWVPRRFAALSDRLTTANGVLLMGMASMIALIYTGGDVAHLVVMYSINVFLTFSLSIFGMLRHYWKERKVKLHWKKSVALFAVGFVLCASILVITIIEKFTEGGWITVFLTMGLVALCFWVKSHYVDVAKQLRHLHPDLENLKIVPGPADRVAVVLVGGYGGLGLQTVVNIVRTFPGVYGHFIFVSIGVIDSGMFKGEDALKNLQSETENTLRRYVQFAVSVGLNASYRWAIGTEVVQVGFDLCQEIAAEFPTCTFFTGKVIFHNEQWYQRLLHNETAISLQKRINLAGHTMVVLPAPIH